MAIYMGSGAHPILDPQPNYTPRIVKYPKIETLFKREEGTFRITPIVRQVDSILALTYISPLVVEEKIDGTNAHILCTYDNKEGFIYRFYSRNNEIPHVGEDIMYIRETLTKVVDIRNIKGWYLDNFVKEGREEYPEVRIYGEVFGYKIQKNIYTNDKERSFRVFDVKINNNWLSIKDRNEFCNKVGLRIVPTITKLNRFISYEEWHYTLYHHPNYKYSLLANEYGRNKELLEGYIIRPEITLYTDRGRVIGKIKRKDFLTEKEKNN